MSYKIFRLISGLYWGLVSYLFILLVMGLGADNFYPQLSFQKLLSFKQLTAFLIAFPVGYFALPRFLNNLQGAKRRAFIGGMLCFALAMFCANTFFIFTGFLFTDFMFTGDYADLNFLGPEPSDLSKVLFHLSGILISSAIISPLGGLFALIALWILPTPDQEPDRNQYLNQSNHTRL
ncbi:hypothetical protein WH96_04930 [Kiloniella spongiae]|uniref:Uncharacterized protein n=1 Tax=Kiloniella spongiae TaxID=1489064 RepID=A0A0H2MHM2_9PROT|nr:hypothetical protein [Kiloniella spongiae]KLN61681.1 hypothetical protein WH96_04930 [Kiloniella spongiae]